MNLQTGLATPVDAIGTSALVNDIAVTLNPATFGIDTPGLFVPVSSTWFLRNASSSGTADATFKYGPGGPDFLPIRGDWDGDGDDTPGLYDRTTGRFHLRNSSPAGPAEVPPFPFGPGGPDFLPIAGDWDGDGVDTVGIRNTATGAVFLKNTNTAGAADVAFVFGGPGGIPMAGDWNGDKPRHDRALRPDDGDVLPPQLEHERTGGHPALHVRGSGSHSARGRLERRRHGHGRRLRFRDGRVVPEERLHGRPGRPRLRLRRAGRRRHRGRLERPMRVLRFPKGRQEPVSHRPATKPRYQSRTASSSTRPAVSKA